MNLSYVSFSVIWVLKSTVHHLQEFSAGTIRLDLSFFGCEIEHRTEMCVIVFGNGMNLRLAKGLIYTRPCDHDGTLLNVPAAPL